MAPSTVKAIWNGPYEGDLGPGNAPLKAGDEVDVSPELLESSHWTPVNPVTPAAAPTATVASPAFGATS